MPLIIERRPEYKDKLIRVPTGKPGQFVKMTEEEAIARGLMPKKAEPTQNKMRRPGLNKIRRPGEGGRGDAVRAKEERAWSPAVRVQGGG